MFNNILQSVCESVESVPLTAVGIVERSIASLAFLSGKWTCNFLFMAAANFVKDIFITFSVHGESGPMS